MALTLANVATIVSQYESEVDACGDSRSKNSNPFLDNLTLLKIQHDLPRLLRTLNEHKTSRSYRSLKPRLYKLFTSVDLRSFQSKEASNVYLARYQKEEPLFVVSPRELSEEKLENDFEIDFGDNYASLRKRLLADGAVTSLDKEKANSETMHDYHETFQEDLLGELSNLASSLKNSALSLSEKLQEDSHLVSETSEKMLKNSTLMSSVGTNLNAYLSAKTGGKITIFFLIKKMVFVFVLFFVMIVLTKILPKM